ncbi:hypothetical protein Q3G72_006470 [Acer saccharum]|nr:hypothetical protein Q3G72_006470 [Acer saccharum]
MICQRQFPLIALVILACKKRLRGGRLSGGFRFYPRLSSSFGELAIIGFQRRGIVIKDSQGLVMGAEVFRLQTGFTPQVAKALAILHGIEFARDMGLVPTKVESDALGCPDCVYFFCYEKGNYGCSFSCKNGSEEFRGPFLA